MFGLSILEIMCCLTTIMAGVMGIIYIEEALNQIDTTFIKLKEVRKTLETQVQTLENQIDELKDCDETVESRFHSDGTPTSGEINKTLVTENKKLHVCCDMLEKNNKALSEYICKLSGELCEYVERCDDMFKKIDMLENINLKL